MRHFSQVRGPPSKTLNRKDKRKAERKLKKARRDAFNQRKFDLMKNLKDVDSAYKLKRELDRNVKAKKKVQQKKQEKKAAKKESENSRLQGLKLANKKEDKELKQLEKHLKFRKKKGKTNLPSSFSSDGLDYILDATDSEKIKDFDDVTTGALLSDDLSNESDGNDSSNDSGGKDSFDEIPGPSLDLSWDAQAKAKKSILKSEEVRSLKKNVKFADNEEKDYDNDGSNFSDYSMSDNEEEESEENLNENSEELFPPVDETENPSSKKETSVLQKSSGKRKLIEDSSPELKEDIYGRLRDKDGNIVKPSASGSYIPPAKRVLMEGSSRNEPLHKKLKGFVNRISEGTIQVLSGQVESLYLDNSRADMNETLASLVMEAIICPSLSPERLVQELAMLIAIIHCNVGSEVGAFFLQKLAVKFDSLMKEPAYGPGKTMDNVLTLLACFYNFKIVHSNFIVDIMKKLMDTFAERDIELLLLVLKWIGFTLRKDNPIQLKQVILDIQTKAREAESVGVDSMQSRIRFMLEVLTALRNNNMSKIPGYNPTHIEHLRKFMKNMIRGQSLGDNQLNISLEDLLKSDKSGRWWIVGSAWEGRTTSEADIKDAKTKTESFSVAGVSKQMLKLAKKQGMNTDIRRHIFCILGTSEDFEDAFTRLLRLGLNRTQEREIIHVMFHCCLNEKEYNPFYGFLANKFCTFDRRFTITVQFTMWDKFKEIDSLDKEPRTNLGHLLAHLLLSKALSLSVFKVIEFGMESKKMIRFLVQVLKEILSSPNSTTITEIFERIAPLPKLKALRQGLQVFMRIHLKGDATKGISAPQLQERLERAEFAMFSQHSSNVNSVL